MADKDQPSQPTAPDAVPNADEQPTNPGQDTTQAAIKAAETIPDAA